MTSARSTLSTEADPAIDALLATAAPVSIVDGLFILPDGDVPGRDGVSRAIQSRLEARLAERIRIAMAGKPG